MSTLHPIDRAAAKAAAKAARAQALKTGAKQRLVTAPMMVAKGLAALFRRPQRPVALSLIAGAVGLAVAGIGLFHPTVQELTSVPPGAVALVNQQPVLMSDFMQEVEQTTEGAFDDATPAQKAQVLHAMINEELLVQRGIVQDMPEQDPDVRTVVVDAVNGQVTAPALANRPTDDQLRAFYNAHRQNYGTQGTMTLVDLVLHVGGFENANQSVEQALADAAQAVYELRSGASLDEVKQHFGFEDSGKVKGMELDFAAQIHLGQKLFSAAKDLTDGEVSDPVINDDGVHVLVMQARSPPVFTSFEDVRNNVYNDYSKMVREQIENQNLDFLRRSSQIILAPDQKE